MATAYAELLLSWVVVKYTKKKKPVQKPNMVGLPQKKNPNMVGVVVDSSSVAK